MFCFLCGDYYEPEPKNTAVEIMSNTGDKVSVHYIAEEDGRIFRLCPACIKAAVFGNMMAGGDLEWIDKIEYEDDVVNDFI